MRFKLTPTEQLLQNLDLLNFPRPVTEYRFHDERGWRLDVAWPADMVCCEVEGGIWMQTKTGRPKGHAHPKRFEQDLEKYNEATLAGWKLVRVTPEMVSLEDGRAVLWLARALGIELGD